MNRWTGEKGTISLVKSLWNPKDTESVPNTDVFGNYHFSEYLKTSDSNEYVTLVSTGYVLFFIANRLWSVFFGNVVNPHLKYRIG